MKTLRLPIFLILLLYILRCGENSDTVVGSRDHSLAIEKSTMPTILADGVSSIPITAFVVDDSGRAALNMKVTFSTTAGTIGESALTDDYGLVTVQLTSVASVTDLEAVVTATVVDPAFSLAKSKVYSVAISTPGFEKSTASLNKSSIGKNTDTITVKFLGLTLTAALKDSVLPADGLTQTSLTASVVETSSRKPVAGSQLVFTSLISKVDAGVATNTQGKAVVPVTAAETVGVDTLYVRLGNVLSTAVTIEYVQPTLKLSVSNQAILADGKSQTEVIAAVLTHKNTPVVGANVEFTTSDGRIQGSGVTDSFGNATVVLVAGETPNPVVKVIASFLSVKDSVLVAFVDAGASMMTISTDKQELLRDGVDAAQMVLAFNGENPADYANRLVHLHADFGVVPDSVITDGQGMAVVPFVADVGTEDVVATIRATFGVAESSVQVSLIGLDVRVHVTQDSLPADGISQTNVRVSLRRSGSKVPISGYRVEFGVSAGIIEQSGVTDEEGVVEKNYSSGTIPGEAALYVYVGKLAVEKRLVLYQNYPSNIVLSTENSYIWVKETGEIEQTNLTAQLLGATGDPVSDPYKVTFTIIQGPDGGEQLITPQGFASQSVTVGSVNGLATVRLLSGTKAGAVLVRTDIVDFPQVAAQSSRIVIRSGPPYMWISPSDPNNVIQRGTIIVPPDKHNVAFTNPTLEIPVTVYFSDKYNNPVEQGTAVYFTTTGGFISSDASTDALGRASVILQNVNPFPVLYSNDPNQYTATNFPNPNGGGSDMLTIEIPDFEGGRITNSLGTTSDNDGVATVVAITNGKNQFGEDIKVWAMGHVVFSVGIHTFHVWADRTTIGPGEVATIYIELWDMNGNPVAAGSQLTVSADAGELTATDLMPLPDRYGFGSTFFSTQLVNKLDPAQDDPKTATVEIELTSPNGDRYAALNINLTI